MITPSNRPLRHCFVIAALLAGLCGAETHAQERGKNGESYTYAEGSPKYWRGLHSRSMGTVFRRDPHIWVVTPELAKKAGLPLEWASDELQGVAAAAYRMQPSGDEDCGWGGNLAACKPIMQCTLDLYFDRQTQKLPWAPNRPVADFDWQEVSSAWHFLPALGWAVEPNGDVSRGSKKSPNYPELGARSPFADPKTGEELVWNTSVLAYDKEMHGRYAFVRVHVGCDGDLGSEPHALRKFQLETKQARSSRIDTERTQPNRPDLDKNMFHEVRLPASWDQRIAPLRKAYVQGDSDFNQGIWKQINSGDTK